MEIFSSALDQIKGWFYNCALIILLLNLFTPIIPEWLLQTATIGTLIAFAFDIVTTIISVISSIGEGEVSTMGVISTIVELLVLVAAVLMFFFKANVFEILGITKTAEVISTLQWAAICIVVYHFSLEIINMPFDLVALFIDEGDFD